MIAENFGLPRSFVPQCKVYYMSYQILASRFSSVRLLFISIGFYDGWATAHTAGTVGWEKQTV